MLCLIALPVFAILGIFSIKYRRLAADALECLFKTVTLRKCKSNLDQRIRAGISGTFLKYSPSAARFTYKNYKLISWIVLIVFLWSFYASAVGVYNYTKYGNCNPPEEVGFCVFDPTGKSSGISEADVDIVIPSETILPSIEDDDPIIGPKDAELTIIEFGCFTCPYTKNAEPIVRKVIEHYKGRVNFQFKTFYIPSHNESFSSALAAECAREQEKYLEYHNRLFEMQDSLNRGTYISIAKELNLDVERFKECLDTERYREEVESDSLMGIYAGVVGTPTFFINDRKIVGPKPFKTFKEIIDEELKNNLK